MKDDFYIIARKDGVVSSKLFKNNKFSLKANEIPLHLSVELDDRIFDGIIHAKLKITKEDIDAIDLFELQFRNLKENEKKLNQDELKNGK